MCCIGRPACVLSVVLIAAFAFGEAESPRPTTTAENASAQPAVVIGFLGGFVKHESMVHSTTQVAAHLRGEFPAQVYVEAFENHRRDDAYREIMRRLDQDHDGSLSTAEKQAARIIIFGHSWGASETVALARKLGRENIPVLLTIQVDSINKIGQNDSVIPSNVAEAVNFYQPHGFFHGRRAIRAADPAHTQIIGNVRVDYKDNPITCENYPWFDRVFMKSHTEIECDPKVWNQVESLIHLKLSPDRGDSSAPGTRSRSLGTIDFDSYVSAFPLVPFTN
jgi:hypothetical protein